MFDCDINCDMGEGIGKDEEIMPYILSANIACTYHAGNEATMTQTILLAKKYGVAAGAHPSYPDKKNFGRMEMNVTTAEIYEQVQTQLIILSSLAKTHGVSLKHVKPHGALYNRSARDEKIAGAIALAVKEHDENLVLFGLSGSHSIKEAQRLGLKTKNEVFADRTYQDDGSLTPRTQPNALITDTNKVVEQVLQMVETKKVKTISGKNISIHAETICIHGDELHAVAFARAVYKVIKGKR